MAVCVPKNIYEGGRDGDLEPLKTLGAFGFQPGLHFPSLFDLSP